MTKDSPSKTCASCYRPITGIPFPFTSLIDLKERLTCAECVDRSCEPVAVVARLRTKAALDHVGAFVVETCTAYWGGQYVGLKRLPELHRAVELRRRRRLAEKQKRQKAEAEAAAARVIDDELTELMGPLKAKWDEVRPVNLPVVWTPPPKRGRIMGFLAGLFFSRREAVQ